MRKRFCARVEERVKERQDSTLLIYNDKNLAELILVIQMALKVPALVTGLVFITLNVIMLAYTFH